eukprot:m.222846 g.222846  ORF g.222846 m.222846 type:complete len:1500 (+) comp17026_c3_seq1:5292-9791(+)
MEHTNIIKLGLLHDVRWWRLTWEKSAVIDRQAHISIDHELFRLESDFLEEGRFVIPCLRARRTSTLPTPKRRVSLYVFGFTDKEPQHELMQTAEVTKGTALDAEENMDVVQLLLRGIMAAIERYLAKSKMIRVGENYFELHSETNKLSDIGIRIRPFLIQSCLLCLRVQAVLNPYRLLSEDHPIFDAEQDGQRAARGWLIPTGDACEILLPNHSRTPSVPCPSPTPRGLTPSILTSTAPATGTAVTPTPVIALTPTLLTGARASPLPTLTLSSTDAASQNASSLAAPSTVSSNGHTPGTEPPVTSHPGVTPTFLVGNPRPACLDAWHRVAPQLHTALSSSTAKTTACVRVGKALGYYPAHLIVVPRPARAEPVSAETQIRLLQQAHEAMWTSEGLILNSIDALNQRYGQLNQLNIQPIAPPTRPLVIPPTRAAQRGGPQGASLNRARVSHLAKQQKAPSNLPWGKAPKQRAKAARFVLGMLKTQQAKLAQDEEAPENTEKMDTATDAKMLADTDNASILTPPSTTPQAPETSSISNHGFGMSLLTDRGFTSNLPELTMPIKSPSTTLPTRSSMPGTASLTPTSTLTSALQTSSVGITAALSGLTSSLTPPTLLQSTKTPSYNVNSISDAKRGTPPSSALEAASKKAKQGYRPPLIGGHRKSTSGLLTPPYDDRDTLKSLLLPPAPITTPLPSSATINTSAPSANPSEKADGVPLTVPTTPRSPQFSAALAPLAVGGTTLFPVPDTFKALPAKPKILTPTWKPPGTTDFVVDQRALDGYALKARPKPQPSQGKSTTAAPMTQGTPSPGHIVYDSHHNEVLESSPSVGDSISSVEFYIFVKHILPKRKSELALADVTPLTLTSLEPYGKLTMCDEQPLLVVRPDNIDAKTGRVCHASSHPSQMTIAPTHLPRLDHKIVHVFLHSMKHASFNLSRLDFKDFLPQAKVIKEPRLSAPTSLPLKQHKKALSLTTAAAHLWYHLGLCPSKGKRDWDVLPVYCSTGTRRASAAWFMKHLQVMYAGLGLGELKQLPDLRITSADDKVLLSILERLQQASSKSGNSSSSNAVYSSRAIVLVLGDDETLPTALASPTARLPLENAAHVLLPRRQTLLNPNDHLQATCFQLFHLSPGPGNPHLPLFQLAPTTFDVDWAVALDHKLAFKASLHVLHCAFVFVTGGVLMSVTDRHGSILDISLTQSSAEHSMEKIAKDMWDQLQRIASAVDKPIHVIFCGAGHDAAQVGQQLRDCIVFAPPEGNKHGCIVTCSCVWFSVDDGLSLDSMTDQKRTVWASATSTGNSSDTGSSLNVSRGSTIAGGDASKSVVSSRPMTRLSQSIASPAATPNANSTLLERYKTATVAAKAMTQRTHRSNLVSNQTKRTERRIVPLAPSLMPTFQRHLSRVCMGLGTYYDLEAQRSDVGRASVVYNMDSHWYRITLLWQERAPVEMITVHMTPRDFPPDSEDENELLSFIAQQYHDLASLVRCTAEPSLPIHLRLLTSFVPNLLV